MLNVAFSFLILSHLNRIWQRTIKREGIIVPIRWRFGKQNSTFYSNLRHRSRRLLRRRSRQDAHFSTLVYSGTLWPYGRRAENDLTLFYSSTLALSTLAPRVDDEAPAKRYDNTFPNKIGSNFYKDIFTLLLSVTKN